MAVTARWAPAEEPPTTIRSVPNSEAAVLNDPLSRRLRVVRRGGIGMLGSEAIVDRHRSDTCRVGDLFETTVLVVGRPHGPATPVKVQKHAVARLRV